MAPARSSDRSEVHFFVFGSVVVDDFADVFAFVEAAAAE